MQSRYNNAGENKHYIEGGSIEIERGDDMDRMEGSWFGRFGLVGLVWYVWFGTFGLIGLVWKVWFGRLGLVW